MQPDDVTPMQRGDMSLQEYMVVWAAHKIVREPKINCVVSHNMFFFMGRQK